jgi:hypothetical protein
VERASVERTSATVTTEKATDSSDSNMVPEVILFECFASPFNVSKNTVTQSTSSSKSSKSKQRIYHHFCTFFPEDRIFGASGSFFEFEPLKFVERFVEDWEGKK